MEREVEYTYAELIPGNFYSVIDDNGSVDPQLLERMSTDNVDQALKMVEISEKYNYVFYLPDAEEKKYVFVREPIEAINLDEEFKTGGKPTRRKRRLKRKRNSKRSRRSRRSKRRR